MFPMLSEKPLSQLTTNGRRKEITVEVALSSFSSTKTSAMPQILEIPEPSSSVNSSTNAIKSLKIINPQTLMSKRESSKLEERFTKQLQSLRLMKVFTIKLLDP